MALRISAVRRLALLQKPSFRYRSMWEPEYLEQAKTKIPEYEPVNFRSRGYDFVILEKYQKELHLIGRTLGLDVSDCWAQPATLHNIKRFKPNTSVIECEHELRLYERNIQVSDVQSPLLPIFIDLATTVCPPGVQLDVVYHTEEIENDRYVPDLELIQLKEQLTQMGGPRKKAS